MKILSVIATIFASVSTLQISPVVHDSTRCHCPIGWTCVWIEPLNQGVCGDPNRNVGVGD